MPIVSGNELKVALAEMEDAGQQANGSSKQLTTQTERVYILQLRGLLSW